MRYETSALSLFQKNLHDTIVSLEAKVAYANEIQDFEYTDSIMERYLRMRTLTTVYRVLPNSRSDPTSKVHELCPGAARRLCHADNLIVRIKKSEPP